MAENNYICDTHYTHIANFLQFAYLFYTNHMEKKYYAKGKEPYQSPSVEAVELMPSQIICGSNENIVPGGETDWAPVFPGSDFMLF